MVARWRTLSSRTILTDRWIDLRADECETENGNTIAPYYVLTYPDWVHVVALTERKELILVEQYRHGAGAVILELPGGVIDRGETPVEAATRELLEETGHAAESWEYVSGLYANPAIQTNRVHTVLARGCEGQAAPRLEPGEDGMTIRFIPLDQVTAGLRDGMLSQAMQVAGLLLALDAAGLR